MRLYRSPKDTTPALVQYGHHKAINALAFDPSTKTLYSGSFCDATGTLRGVLLGWDLAKGVASAFDGVAHTNGIMALSVCGSTISSPHLPLCHVPCPPQHASRGDTCQVCGSTVVACSTDDTVCSPHPTSRGATWHALLTLLPVVPRGMLSSPSFPC